MTTPEDTMRAEFEAAMANVGYEAPTRFTSGEYCMPYYQAGWAMWQAARRQQAPSLTVGDAQSAVFPAIPAKQLTPFDAIERAMDLAGLYCGSVAMKDREQTETYRGKLRAHLMTYIYPDEGERPLPAAWRTTLDAASALLSSFAACGMTHEYDDGEPTENATMCLRVSRELDAIIEAVPSQPAAQGAGELPEPFGYAWHESHTVNNGRDVVAGFGFSTDEPPEDYEAAPLFTADQMQAYARAALAQAPAAEPALYLSHKQVQGVIDGTLEPKGTGYIPFRREREGLFTVPVYAPDSNPQPANKP